LHPTVLGKSASTTFAKCGAASFCYQDMRLFNQKTIALTLKHVRELLTPQQLENYPNYCIIPRDPTLPLSTDNSVAVTNYQRRYIVGCWKEDPAGFCSALELMMGGGLK
jgi:hypothetical protein